MTPAEYRILRKSIGTQAKVAALLGVDRVTIARRESGTMRITREAELAIEMLGKVPKISEVPNG